MDFTSLALLKNASKKTVEALDSRDKNNMVSLPVRQIEKLRQALIGKSNSSHDVVYMACSIMSYSQLIQFLISCEKLSVDGLSNFFKGLDGSKSLEATGLKKRLTYLLHSVYFADVFTDAKIVK